MKFLTSTVISALLLASHASAQDFGAELSFNANPVEQSIVIFENGSSRLVRANLEKRPGSMLISAAIGVLEPQALVAASATLSNGEIRSSALQHPDDEMSGQTSASLLAQEIASQEGINTDRKRQLEDLNREIETVSSDLRMKAGLEKVDAMYQRISELKELISVEQKRSAELDQLLAAQGEK